MKKSIILILICVSGFVFAISNTNKITYSNENNTWTKSSFDDFEKELSDVQKFFSESIKFSVNVTHSTFKGINNNVAYEKKSGKFIRDGKSYRSSIMGMITIQNEKLKIIIDTVGKTILIASPDKLEPSNIVSLDYVQTKKNIKTVLKKTENNTKKYKLEYSFGQYLSSEITIGSDSNIKEIIIVFREKYHEVQGDKNSPMVNPKAVISFTDFKKNPSINKSVFDFSSYINISDKGAITGIKSYKNYNIVDTRYNYDPSKK